MAGLPKFGAPVPAGTSVPLPCSGTRKHGLVGKRMGPEGTPACNPLTPLLVRKLSPESGGLFRPPPHSSGSTERTLGLLGEEVGRRRPGPSLP